MLISRTSLLLRTRRINSPTYIASLRACSPPRRFWCSCPLIFFSAHVPFARVSACFIAHTAPSIPQTMLSAHSRPPGPQGIEICSLVTLGRVGCRSSRPSRHISCCARPWPAVNPAHCCNNKHYAYSRGHSPDWALLPQLTTLPNFTLDRPALSRKLPHCSKYLPIADTSPVYSSTHHKPRTTPSPSSPTSHFPPPPTDSCQASPDKALLLSPPPPRGQLQRLLRCAPLYPRLVLRRPDNLPRCRPGPGLARPPARLHRDLLPDRPNFREYWVWRGAPVSFVFRATWWATWAGRCRAVEAKGSSEEQAHVLAWIWSAFVLGGLLKLPFL
jgi:hypothetical protein